MNNQTTTEDGITYLVGPRFETAEEMQAHWEEGNPVWMVGQTMRGVWLRCTDREVGPDGTAVGPDRFHNSDGGYVQKAPTRYAHQFAPLYPKPGFFLNQRAGIAYLSVEGAQVIGITGNRYTMDADGNYRGCDGGNYPTLSFGCLRPVCPHWDGPSDVEVLQEAQDEFETKLRELMSAYSVTLMPCDGIFSQFDRTNCSKPSTTT